VPILQRPARIAAERRLNALFLVSLRHRGLPKVFLPVRRALPAARAAGAPVDRAGIIIECVDRASKIAYT
jgi:hypothetical protein